MSYEESDSVQHDTYTDNGIEIDELYLRWSGPNRAFIKSIPHVKLRTAIIVTIDGSTYIQDGIDRGGRLIFEEI